MIMMLACSVNIVISHHIMMIKYADACVIVITEGGFKKYSGEG